jgi:hypothetical protein
MDHLTYFNGAEGVPLRHPGEGYHLAELGTTDERALSEGRLFYDDYCVCRECVSVVVRRTLRLPGVGIVPDLSSLPAKLVLTIGAIPAIAFGLFLEWRGWVVVLVMLLPAAVVDAVCARLNRSNALRAAERRWLEAGDSRGADREITRCSHCGGSRLQELLTYLVEQRAADGGTTDSSSPDLRCPQCGDRTLHDDPEYMSIA